MMPSKPGGSRTDNTSSSTHQVQSRYSSSGSGTESHTSTLPRPHTEQHHTDSVMYVTLDHRLLPHTQSLPRNSSRPGTTGSGSNVGPPAPWNNRYNDDCTTPLVGSWPSPTSVGSPSKPREDLMLGKDIEAAQLLLPGQRESSV